VCAPPKKCGITIVIKCSGITEPHIVTTSYVLLRRVDNKLYSFNYENTSSITHEIAGDLLGYGLEPGVVSESVYERRTLTDIKLLGLVLSTLRVSKSGEVAYLKITKKMLEETGADVNKSEGFINYARSIEGIKVAVLFKEDPKNPNSVNVSFRSKAGVDVNDIALSFGGGGHVKASGCVLEGSLADVEAKVIAKIEDALKNKPGFFNRKIRPER